ncbi:hypothetical protein [Micromonospora sp. NPDC005299]
MLPRAPQAQFHISDGSHRWIAPGPDYDQEVWDGQVRQHNEGT